MAGGTSYRRPEELYYDEEENIYIQMRTGL
jgi:hypothetical protein